MKIGFFKPLLAVTLVVAIGLVVPVACGLVGSSSESPGGQAVPAPARPPSAGQDSSGSQGVTGGSSGSLPAISPERMIVRNGNMSLTVKDVAASRDAVSQLANRLEGYTVSTSFSGKEGALKGSITIRVPDDKFEQALSGLRIMAVKVQSESTSSQDVTEEYVDLTARLKTAEAAESQYLTLLAKAATVEDILKVQEKLSQVRREIEQIKGRKQYLERQTSMSLITVYLELDVSASSVVAFDWNLMDELRTAARGFVIFLTLLATLFIWVLIFSPVWGGVIAIVYFTRRWKRRKQKIS